MTCNAVLVATTKRTTTPSTRERIVEVAIDLFDRQGYGGTSLRHIAEQLGITKAAVYHHFHTKEDIAREVVLRALDAQQSMADRILVAGSDPGAWQRAFPQVIDIALRERPVLTALERNEDTFIALFADDPEIAPRLTSQGAPIAGLLNDPAVSPVLRVRFGAILGPLIFFADHYQDIPADQLRDELIETMTVLTRDLPSGG
jgi:AcrR family transcriptional regulator